MSGSVASYRDGDFSFSLARRSSDELDDLVAAHNELGDVLREQRQALVQRELLLDTMVQNTPVALLLAEPRGAIVYANLAARQLLNDGRKLEGLRFAQLLERTPAAAARGARARRRRPVHVRARGTRKRPTTSRAATSTSTARRHALFLFSA